MAGVKLKERRNKVRHKECFKLMFLSDQVLKCTEVGGTKEGWVVRVNRLQVGEPLVRPRMENMLQVVLHRLAVESPTESRPDLNVVVRM